MAKTKQASGDLQSIDINELANEINALTTEDRPKRTNTKRHIIEQLRQPMLDALLNRGCTYAQLVELLQKRGIKIHLITLRKYLGSLSEHRKGLSPEAPKHAASSDDALVQQKALANAAPLADLPPPAEAPKRSDNEATTSTGRFKPSPGIPLDKL
ncbi:MAG: hypothetical protein HC808_18595 [Candidatus Competibacteraceae bacterium]|nr:hypothetical protein [Candidatus Competibacteraceae bacterium]